MLFKGWGSNSTYQPKPDEPFQLTSPTSSDIVACDGCNPVFPTTHHQRVYIQNWLHSNAIPPSTISSLSVNFYPARYHPGHHSIFSVCDTVTLALAVNTGLRVDEVDEETEGDVIILEEPEVISGEGSFLLPPALTFLLPPPPSLPPSPLAPQLVPHSLPYPLLLQVCLRILNWHSPHQLHSLHIPARLPFLRGRNRRKGRVRGHGSREL